MNNIKFRREEEELIWQMGEAWGRIEIDAEGRLYTWPQAWKGKDSVTESWNIYQIDHILALAWDWLWENEFDAAWLELFFVQRPALRISAIEREAGLGTGTLSKAVKGRTKLTPAVKEKLKPVLRHYGFTWKAPPSL